MPVRIYHDDISPCTIRPTPLVSIGTNILKNGAGEAFGVTYSITLTGTILVNQGSPYAHDKAGLRYPFHGTPSPTPNSIGPYAAFDSNVSHFESNRPPMQQVPFHEESHAIFFKQKVLRALFANGKKLEITDINDDEATIICYPRIVDINFTEGVYVDRADYTITLEADTLLDKDLNVDSEGTLVALSEYGEGLSETDLLVALDGAFVSDFSEDWSIETDDSVGEAVGLPRTYRISHSLNATGKTHYGPNGTSKAWEQAKKFVQKRLSLSVSGANDYPNIMGKIGSGIVNLVNTYNGFNHIRSEQLSESNGTYSVTENWVLASGKAYENYNISISSSSDAPFINVSIDGNIKGLSEYAPSSIYFGGNDLSVGYSSAYSNALNKYNQITNTGQFGISSNIYKRANNTVAVQLNSQPKSISLGQNEYVGEITYALQFDNRPTNIIPGVISESISVNDTYPGDVFAIIPVIGRATGPILQYIGGRTEYKRDISINLIMDYTDIPYGSERNPLLLKKPSVVEPTATQLANLIKELSPSNEPGIRKYFVSPPSESWNPKEGSYGINISWTYELDK